MSLFKAREWWSSSIGGDEELDNGCLCVANIDNSQSGYDKVIVGSFHGVLRIYQPKNSKGQSKEEHVLLETQLQYPIIQLEAGKFVSATEDIHLAVLHPRKLAVYSISGQTGAVEHGNQYQIQLSFEHNLQRTAHSMTCGPFGNIKGKDFMCVQSMDGTVSIFEQESFSFSRFLPGFLLPGPLKYIARTDSFVTVSSSRQVECYKYQVLAVASDSKTKEESQKLTTGKKITADWTFQIGEQAMDIKVVNYSQAPPSVLVLGERNLYCFKDTGTLRFMKKFDFNPSCFLPYASLSEGTLNTLICTHTNSLLVFEDVTLKWVAQLEHTPVEIQLGSFQDLRGVIVTVDEAGHLTCSYLGTDPSLAVVPTPESREINYQEQDQEMKRLQRVIKEASHKSVDINSRKLTEEDIEILISVPSSLDNISQGSESEVKSDDPIPSITVKIMVKSKLALQNVKLSIEAPYPITANQNLFLFPSLSSPGQALVSFFQRGNCLPPQLSVQACMTYSTPMGAPRILQKRFGLPLQLVCHPCPPFKNATHKITVDTNKASVGLDVLFPELSGENVGSNPNAFGLQLFGGPKITILASKTSQRYRIQCDMFEAMWLVMKALVDRLYAEHQSMGISDFRCFYESSLPLQEYFTLIDIHFELRLGMERCKEVLAQRAQQFRSIQRRLLTRFKDKTPSPLQNLDTLLEGSYRQILQIAETMEENKRALVKCSAGLSAATRMINLLIKLLHGLNGTETKILQSTLIPEVTFEGEQGWEEAVNASVSHLLRTCLAKSAKDQTLNPTPIQMPRDTTKLKKHITMMVDKLGKGAKLQIEGADFSDSKGEVEDGLTKPVGLTTTANKPPLPDSHKSHIEASEEKHAHKSRNKKSPRSALASETNHALTSDDRAANLPPTDSLPSLQGALPPLSRGGEALPPLNTKSLPELKPTTRILKDEELNGGLFGRKPDEDEVNGGGLIGHNSNDDEINSLLVGGDSDLLDRVESSPYDSDPDEAILM